MYAHGAMLRQLTLHLHIAADACQLGQFVGCAKTPHCRQEGALPSHVAEDWMMV
jgi:hypothetical protein